MKGTGGGAVAAAALLPRVGKGRKSLLYTTRSGSSSVTQSCDRVTRALGHQSTGADGACRQPCGCTTTTVG
ncbi:hypothetical protein GQ53DRAFT_756403 [Thozetella sp. PMI_491]|nr:hypothetical protein GQ53DRAFT_756403 [Thozetella sp. PMI_491]